MTSALLLTLVFFMGVIATHGALLNINPLYGNWLKLFPTDPYVRIPVFIDEAQYTKSGDTACLNVIKAAVAAINTSLNGCVAFAPLLRSSVNVGKDFIWISNSFNNNTLSPTCSSLPGRYYTQNQRGQKIIIVGTTGGLAPASCCTIREVMKHLAHALGLENEYQRPDRQMTVNSANIHASLTKYNIFNFIQPSEAILPTSDKFDRKSITMPVQTKYTTTGATGNLTAYDLTTAGLKETVGDQDLLSYIDCSAIAEKYGCVGTCADPYLGIL